MNRLTSTLVPYIALFSFFVLIVSFYKRNDFTSSLETVGALNQEPEQNIINQPPFFADYNDETFEIIPKYDYELYGLVVSYRLHDASGSTMIHDLTKDHLNVADFCVVWGTSADSTLLKDMEFSNGQFTCQYSGSHAVWDKFNHDQLSNNHLLALDDNIRKQIDKVNIGDQIRIKGWLSHYVNPLGSERGTSITRTDTGNGACETIFVNEIELLKPMSSLWKRLMWLSLVTFFIAMWVLYHKPIEASDFAKSE